MDIRLSFSVRQLVFLLFLALLMVAALSLGIFLLGQQNARLLSNAFLTPAGSSQSQGGQAAPATIAAALPRASTATSRPQAIQEMIMTDSQATQLAQEEAAQSLSIPLQVESVNFVPGRVTMTGMIDYLGFSGDFLVTGTPYVSENRLRLQVDSFTLSGQPLPESFYADLEVEINKMFDQIFTGYDIQSVVAETGQIRLTVLPW